MNIWFFMKAMLLILFEGLIVALELPGVVGEAAVVAEG